MTETFSELPIHAETAQSPEQRHEEPLAHHLQELLKNYCSYKHPDALISYFEKIRQNLTGDASLPADTNYLKRMMHAPTISQTKFDRPEIQADIQTLNEQLFQIIKTIRLELTPKADNRIRLEKMEVKAAKHRPTQELNTATDFLAASEAEERKRAELVSLTAELDFSAFTNTELVALILGSKEAFPEGLPSITFAQDFFEAL